MALANRSGGRFPLRDLLANAMGHARAGVPVSESQARLTATKLGELREVPGFAAVYLARIFVRPGVFWNPPIFSVSPRGSLRRCRSISKALAFSTCRLRRRA
jgi:gamma-glutamyltranspeptidase